MFNYYILCIFPSITTNTFNRFAITARKSATTGYITKFLSSYFDTHSDLTSASYTMDLMSPGTNSIISLTGITISASASETVTTFTPTSYTPTYVQISFQSVETAVTSVCGDGSLATSAGES